MKTKLFQSKSISTKPIRTLAIANRGEVAVRIIRACQELGIKSVLLHSDADIKSRAYRLADKKIGIGPAAIAESYLSIERTLQGALAGGADAVHPGFGFLSENADFAQACLDADLLFVGPSPAAIRTLGDKVKSKEIAKKLGIPLVPGYEGERQDTSTLVREVERIGLPVIVKAAAGGGGRGMKVIYNVEEACELIESAQREASAAFGSSKVFLEKYLNQAKHIEFQIFADPTGRVIHLFERECSVQRRHQKIIEEAPSPSLNPTLREQMGMAAVTLVEEVGYRGAGTVEFLLQDGAYYFMEMNTRLQVEHPVTEMVMGVDLVRAQILTAQGLLPTFFDSLSLAPRGHSIECRLYAENPYLGGVPSTGILNGLHWPENVGRRFEYGFDEGDEITPYYDPMIAKLIVWDETRDQAIRKMLAVLEETVVFGVHTNIPLLHRILEHPDFTSGRMTTRFFENHFSQNLPSPEMTSDIQLFIDAAKRRVHSTSSDTILKAERGPWNSFWRNV